MSAWLLREPLARSRDDATNSYRFNGIDFAPIARSTYVANRRNAPPAGSTAQKRLVRVTQRFDASPQRLSSAWLVPDIARKWLFAMATRAIDEVEIDARVGGAFRLARAEGDEHVGHYLEIIPDKRLAFTLATSLLPSTRTHVQVDFAALPGCSAVTLSHAGVPRGFSGFMRDRWLGMLYGLAVALDSF